MDIWNIWKIISRYVTEKVHFLLVQRPDVNIWLDFQLLSGK